MVGTEALTLAGAFDAIANTDGLAVPEVSLLLLTQAFVAVVLQMGHFCWCGSDLIALTVYRFV